MTEQSKNEYTGFSNTGIQDAVDNALQQISTPYDRVEIIETFSNNRDQQGNYQVTLKTVCEQEG